MKWNYKTEQKINCDVCKGRGSYLKKFSHNFFTTCCSCEGAGFFYKNEDGRVCTRSGRLVTREIVPHAKIQTVKAEDIQKVRKFGEEHG